MKNFVTVGRVHTHTHTNSLENNKNIIIKIKDSNMEPVILDTG